MNGSLSASLLGSSPLNTKQQTNLHANTIQPEQGLWRTKPNDMHLLPFPSLSPVPPREGGNMLEGGVGGPPAVPTTPRCHPQWSKPPDRQTPGARHAPTLRHGPTRPASPI